MGRDRVGIRSQASAEATAQRSCTSQRKNPTFSRNIKRTKYNEMHPPPQKNISQQI